MTTDTIFDAAFIEHQAGRLAEAQLLYQQVIKSDPRHSAALHLMGVLAYQAGQMNAAETLIREAIKDRTHIFYQATRVTSSLNLESFKAEVAHGLGADDLLTDRLAGHAGLPIHVGRFVNHLAGFRIDLLTGLEMDAGDLEIMAFDIVADRLH